MGGPLLFEESHQVNTSVTKSDGVIDKSKSNPRFLCRWFVAAAETIGGKRKKPGDKKHAQTADLYRQRRHK